MDRPVLTHSATTANTRNIEPFPLHERLNAPRRNPPARHAGHRVNALTNHSHSFHNNSPIRSIRPVIGAVARSGIEPPTQNILCSIRAPLCLPVCSGPIDTDSLSVAPDDQPVGWSAVHYARSVHAHLLQTQVTWDHLALVGVIPPPHLSRAGDSLFGYQVSISPRRFGPVVLCLPRRADKDYSATLRTATQPATQPRHRPSTCRTTPDLGKHPRKKVPKKLLADREHNEQNYRIHPQTSTPSNLLHTV